MSKAKQASRIFTLMLLVILPSGSQAGPSWVSPPDDRGPAFVLESARGWGEAEEAAVIAAGGELVFRHDATGLAIARSERADFPARLARRGGLKATVDQLHLWASPPALPDAALYENAITPGDETLIDAQWNQLAVEAPAAWAAGYTGLGVRVAIVDGGIHSTHIDLDANLDVAASRSFVPGFAFNEDVGPFWHGTHVAGIVAAEDNGIGVIGIAPEATIIGVKVLHEGYGSFGQVIMGILYAADPIAEGGAGADIINLSLGGAFPRGGSGGGGPLVSAMAKAVNYANSRGVLVVCAAGNHGVDFDHEFGTWIFVPAQSAGALAVSATGPLGYAVGWPQGATDFRRPASYTNYGNSLVSLAAPGGDFVLPGDTNCHIPGTFIMYCWAFDLVLSTVRGYGGNNRAYNFSAGTSMAAPVVSAVAALAKQRFPQMDSGRLKTFLAQTADDEGKAGNDPWYGKGFVNARRVATESDPWLASEPVRPGLPSAALVTETWLAATPSPARAATTLRFGLPRDAEVSLALYDTSGRRVGRPTAGRMAAGEHSVRWDLADANGARVQPGLYFAKLTVDGRSTIGRVVVLP